MRLLLASGNRKKLVELQRITAPLGVEVVQPADIGGLPDCDEDGETFAANPAKKATAGENISMDQVAAAHVGYQTRFPSLHISLGGTQGASWTASGSRDSSSTASGKSWG